MATRTPQILVDKQDRDIDLGLVLNRGKWFVEVRCSQHQRAARIIAARKLKRKLEKREYVSFLNSQSTDLRRLNLIVKVQKRSPSVQLIKCDKRDRDLHLRFAASGCVYAGNSRPRKYASRVIAERELGRELTKDECVVHRNHVLADVRRSNLVVTSRGHCQRAKGSQRGKTSQYKGVCWDKRGEKWEASIRLPGSAGCRGKKKHLGYFEDECDAAVAFNKATRELGLSYAFLNDV